jgi:hypothetical protein
MNIMLYSCNTWRRHRTYDTCTQLVSIAHRWRGNACVAAIIGDAAHALRKRLSLIPNCYIITA